MAVVKKDKEKGKEIDEVLVEEPLEEAAAVEIEVPEIVGVVPAVNGTPVKKPLGVKEVIPFKWKLVGTAHHTTLTLFKAVEREDVEAQLERVQREGYYTDLRIFEKDAKVVQPKQPPKPPEPRVVKSNKSATSAAKPSKVKAASEPKSKPKKTVTAPKAKVVIKPKKIEKSVKKAAKKK